VDENARSVRRRRKGDARRRLTTGAVIVLVLVALAVTVVVGMIRTAASPIEEVPLAPATPSQPGVYVHISGAIERPGLYRLAPGARVVDAVAAAGGFADDAFPAGVNLARPISDGEQLQVPAKGEETVDEPSSPGAADSRVNLNTADAATLETLPRIGPALAGRIIEWRDQYGRFTSVDDLLAVAGIGEKMLSGLRDHVTV
jgi:competence protein ComEA